MLFFPPRVSASAPSWSTSTSGGPTTSRKPSTKRSTPEYRSQSMSFFHSRSLWLLPVYPHEMIRRWIVLVDEFNDPFDRWLIDIDLLLDESRVWVMYSCIDRFTRTIDWKIHLNTFRYIYWYNDGWKMYWYIHRLVYSSIDWSIEEYINWYVSWLVVFDWLKVIGCLSTSRWWSIPSRGLRTCVDNGVTTTGKTSKIKYLKGSKVC